jgi:tetratricopeptide (TPR) repeat protein
VVINRILSRGDSAEARLLLGTTKLQALDHEGALADLEKAIALNGRLPGAHARLGELLLAMGEIARAAAAFRQELALDPTDFVSNLNIGVLAKQDQEYSDARLYLEHALRSRPGDPGVRYQLALLDLATGGLDQARKALETLMGESPGFAEVHGTLATVYYRLDRTADGDRERALAQKLTDERQAAQRGVLPRERQTRESQPR